jgi:protein SPT2
VWIPYFCSRYANLDDEDDECMEASYSEQLKEEFRSTKAGILEDLREARLEKMRKKKALGKGK